MTTALAPTRSRSASIQERAAAFRASSTRRAVLQILTTIVPMAATFAVMFWSLGVSYWLTLALVPFAAGFYIRTFIIMHDCGHGSFLPNKRANEIVGFITGVITLTPFGQWRRDHALHHASSGDLDRRGHGDIDTLTIDEYRALDRWGQFKYRFYRNTAVMLLIGPLYLLVHHRLSPPSSATRASKVSSVMQTNIAVFALLAGLSWLVGVRAMLLVYAPVFYVASMAGIWLFYVQHQHEEAYWEPHEQWDYVTAAMMGSSFYRLPRVLEWFTGSIGRHHVHHVDPRIPNYLLKDCHEAVDEFRTVPELTIAKSIRTTGLKLWDPEQRRLVGYDALKRLPASTSTTSAG